jgi:hypothetical protein
MVDIFRHIAEVEGSPGEIRPISVNIVGLFLNPRALANEPRVPLGWSGGELLREYVRGCLLRLPEQTPQVLARMLTDRATPDPKPLQQSRTLD